MSKILSSVALALSIVACLIALWRHVDHMRAARAALQEREAEIIQYFNPHFQQMSADFDISGYPTDPQTLEEAFDPILQMIQEVSATPGP